MGQKLKKSEEKIENLESLLDKTAIEILELKNQIKK